MVPSTSPEPPTVHVHVRTGSPLAEVFLIDHDFALVRRSIGDLDTTVEPGVYKVKAKLADAETERLVLCDEDRDIDLSAELRIASPAPLTGTTRAGGPDGQLARSLAASLGAQPAPVGEILLVARRWQPTSEPLQVSVHDHSDARLPFPSTTGDLPADGALLAVDPGRYFLRWQGAGGVAVEQTVYAVAGWQTQVFVLDEPGEGPSLGATRVSVQMSRVGFDPASIELRRAEEARTALAEERRISSAAFEDLLEGFENPMLGLIGAHLMLLGRDSDQRPFRTSRPRTPARFDGLGFERLVHRLQVMLGVEHPDVVALTTQLAGAPSPPLRSIAAPPMLWRSWQLLIEASNDAPWLVDRAVWRRAAGSLPLRPFLIWAGEPADTADRAEDVLTRALRASDTTDDVRRELTNRMLVPRSVVDACAPDP